MMNKWLGLTVLIVILIVFWPSREHNMSGYGVGYGNRVAIQAYIPNTYGGTDQYVKKDPRFGA